MRTFPTKLLALASACALGLLACKGDTGPAGATGATGANGISTGSIAGTLTFKITPTSSPSPATGVPVSAVVNGATAASTTSDSTGAYSLTLPIGTYTVVFGDDVTYTKLQVDGIVVVAAPAPYALSEVLTHKSPVIVTPGAIPNPAGFNQSVTLSVSVTGGTAPYTYSWAPAATNPTAVTLSSATSATPSFTTDTLANILAGGKVVGLNLPNRLSFVGVSTTQLASMTYNFNVTVTDAQGYVSTAMVGAVPSTLTQAEPKVPLGRMVIGNDPGNTVAYTLTVKPTGSNPTVYEASGPNPFFTPDAAGTYTLSNGTNSLTVAAGTYVSSSPTCGFCHTPGGQGATNLASKFAQWSASAHGNYFWKTGVPAGLDTAVPNATTIFAAGVDGLVFGNLYTETRCGPCHTVGYQKLSVANGGFLDVKVANPYVFPDNSTVDVNRYKNTVPAALQALAGIQCESCHGPLGGTHSNLSNAPAPVWGVEVCAQCHDAMSHHDKFNLWAQSKHADYDLTQEAVVELRGTTAAHCGRCHSAQGFGTYVDQQQAGNAGPIVRPAGLTPAPATCTPVSYPPTGPVDPACPCTPTPPATTCTGDPAFYAYLSGLGLNQAQVERQTCQTCHDPHTTTIRVDTNTGPLANGWQMNGAGAGALCMVCHNTRNGARGDYVAIPGSGIGGPHAPVQADLLMGQNAYFMGAAGQLSKHAAVGDTCVGCHLALHPASIAPTGTNHTFAVDDTICKNCHGTGVNLDALSGQFLISRGKLETALATAFTAAVGGATPNYWVLVLDPAGSGAYAVVNLTVAPTNIVPSGRQQNLAMTFAAPGVSDGWGNTVTTLTVNYRRVSLTSANNGTSFNNPLFSTSGIIAKANWNYWLVSSVSPNPAANVIHNPSFVWEVLSNTTGALLSAAASGGAGL